MGQRLSASETSEKERSVSVTRCQAQKLSRLALDASQLFWQTDSVMESLIRLDVAGFTLPAMRRGNKEQSEIPRGVYPEHPERDPSLRSG